MNKENQNLFCINNSFLGMIDKKVIQLEFNISEKTSERILNRNNIIHVSVNNIEKIKMFIDGISTSEIARRFNVSEVSVNALAKRHGIMRPIGFLNDISFDYFFFDNIDTEFKAYTLGFIYADGCVSEKEVKIAIKYSDIDILNKIKLCMNGEFNIRKSINSNSYGNSEIGILYFSNKHTIQSLRNIGIKKNKTLDCDFPNIENHLIKHFIRGYMDGDGSFGKYLGVDGYERYSFSFVGTMSFLGILISKIKENGFKISEKQNKRFDTPNCCYNVYGSGKSNVLAFLDWIYLDSNIYLDRKYHKYLSIK
jgi:hypothetical protein